MITQQMIDNADEIEILSGEGDEGTLEDFKKARTVRAVKRALTIARCEGDRWAVLILDGNRVSNHD